MLRIKRLLAMGCLIAAAGSSWADIDATLPTLAGGIDLSAYRSCQTLRQQCLAKYGSAEMPGQIACINGLNVSAPACQQLGQIEAHTGVVPQPDDIHRVGAMTWFSVRYPADGIEAYFMLDSAGRLLSLASSQNPLLAEAPLYQQFIKPYPDGALQSMVATAPQATPTAIRQSPDGAVQLVFKQYLKKNDCVACEVVGQAKVVYYFDVKGHYQAPQLIAVEPVTSTDPKK